MIIFSILFRLYCAPRYFHVDIFTNAAWGEWIENNRPRGFYDKTTWVYSWPTQPPLINLIYAGSHYIYRYLIIYLLRFGFLLRHLGLNNANYLGLVANFNQPLSSEIPFSRAYLFSIKLLPILTDIIIALLIYLLLPKKVSLPRLIYPLLYLLSHFSWYLSAFWGKYDQLSFLLVLSAFLTLKKYPLASPIFFSLSLGVKPTSAIFIPFYLYLLYLHRKLYLAYFTGIIFSVLFNLYLIQLFSPNSDILIFTRHRLLPAVINKSEYRVTVNSYNFWYLLVGDRNVNHRSPFLFFSYFTYSLIALVIVNFLAIKFYCQKHLSSKFFISLFTVAFGTWLFGTNMLERYLFAGIVSLLFLSTHQFRYFKIWLIASLVFFINLYKNWWVPNLFIVLKYFYQSHTLISTSLFPLFNLAIYFYLLKHFNDS